MPKHEKEAGIPKPSTLKRIDPQHQPYKKAGRKRKEYPPHWKVSLHNFGYCLQAHNAPCRIRPYFAFEGNDRPNRDDLVELLGWWASKHPETLSLPVRFINCQPVECGREVIPN